MVVEEIICGKVKEQGIPLTTLARRTGVSYQPLKRSMNGMRRLRSDELVALAKYFGISIDAIIEESSDAVDEGGR